MKRVYVLVILCVLLCGYYIKSRDLFQGAQEARVGFGSAIAENDFIKKCVQGLEADTSLKSKILEKGISVVQTSEFLNESCKCLWTISGTTNENLASNENAHVEDHMKKTLSIPTPQDTAGCIDQVFVKFKNESLKK